jgi:hypothetical protein
MVEVVGAGHPLDSVATQGRANTASIDEGGGVESYPLGAGIHG